MTQTLPDYPDHMQQGVATFHRVFKHPDGILEPGPLTPERAALRVKLIDEESVEELYVSALRGDLVETLDALVDTIYVALGSLVELGVEYQGKNYSVETLNTQKLLDAAVVAHFEDPLECFRRSCADDDWAGASRALHFIVNKALRIMAEAGFDPRPLFDEVQRSNMSKLGPDGEPITSRGEELDGAPLGKTIKGPNYTDPDLRGVLAAAGIEIPVCVSQEFYDGAVAGIATLSLYFLNENEEPMYAGLSKTELDDSMAGALQEAVHDELRRLQRKEQ